MINLSTVFAVGGPPIGCPMPGPLLFRKKKPNQPSRDFAYDTIEGDPRMKFTASDLFDVLAFWFGEHF